MVQLVEEENARGILPEGRQVDLMRVSGTIKETFYFDLILEMYSISMDGGAEVPVTACTMTLISKLYDVRLVTMNTIQVD